MKKKKKSFKIDKRTLNIGDKLVATIYVILEIKSLTLKSGQSCDT